MLVPESVAIISRNRLCRVALSVRAQTDSFYNFRGQWVNFTLRGCERLIVIKLKDCRALWMGSGIGERFALTASKIAETDEHDDFDIWSESVCRVHTTLSAAERFALVHRLVWDWSPQEQQQLHEQLSAHLTRDFLVRLPVDMSHHLLSYLNLHSLLVCCQVSKDWNRIISEDNRFWKALCVQYGFTKLKLNGCQFSSEVTDKHDTASRASILLRGGTRLRKYENQNLNAADNSINDLPVLITETGPEMTGDTIEKSEDSLDPNSDIQIISGTVLNDQKDVLMGSYKNWFLRCRRYMKGLETGTSIESIVLFGHTDRVMAIYYYNGRIATGSDDRTVRVWNCSTGTCIICFAAHSVSALKFDDNWLMTASYDTTAKLWNVKDGTEVQVYEGHVACVFGIDYNSGLDRVVTGSSDSTVKIWAFLSGQLLRTLLRPDGSTEWTISVRLFIDGDDNDCTAATHKHDLKHYRVFSSDGSSVGYWTVELSTGGGEDKLVGYTALLLCPDRSMKPGYMDGLDTSHDDFITVLTLSVPMTVGRSEEDTDDESYRVKVLTEDIFVMTDRPFPYSLRCRGMSLTKAELCGPKRTADTRNEVFTNSDTEFRYYLGAEERFAAALCYDDCNEVLPESYDGTRSSIHVWQRRVPDPLGCDDNRPTISEPTRIFVPTNNHFSKRASTITLGDRTWMTGLNPDAVAGQVLYAIALNDNTVYVAKFARSINIEAQ